jgi:hypothetical protein
MKRFYRMLLVLYPRNFRNMYGEEQAQVFDEMWQQTLCDRNIIAAWLVAIRAVTDVIITALLKGNQKSGAAQHIFSALALLFVIPSAIFATVNITKYNLGESALYDWWGSTGIHFSDTVILLGPLAAMAVLLLPLVRFSPGSTMILHRSDQKLALPSLVIAGVSVMLMGIFLLYGIAENVISTL